jgi:hypothetical protein
MTQDLQNPSFAERIDIAGPVQTTAGELVELATDGNRRNLVVVVDVVPLGLPQVPLNCPDQAVAVLAPCDRVLCVKIYTD